MLASPVSCLPFLGNSQPNNIPITNGKGIYYAAICGATTPSYRMIHAEYPAFPNDNHICTFCKNANFIEQYVCLITLDSATQRNKIIFDRGDTTNISGYLIFRENKFQINMIA